MSKPRVIKAYDAVDHEIKKQLRVQYPYGFDKNLISFKDAKGKLVSALPYESMDRHYLIKMTSAMAAANFSAELEKSSDEEENYDEVVDLVEEEELELDPKKEKVEA